MIIIKHAKVTITKDGERIPHSRRVLEKRPNDWLEELDFDYLKPSNWKKFLYNEFRTKEGYKLPVKTKAGEEVVYEVFIYGVPTHLVERAKFYTSNRSGGVFSLFPGYPGMEEKFRNEKGRIKPLNFAKYGRLI